MRRLFSSLSLLLLSDRALARCAIIAAAGALLAHADAACTGASYSYGTSTCSTCPAGATVVSGNARGCTPSSALTSGPSDSLAFYLSGTAAEGVAAFSIAPTSPAYTTGVYGAANSALYFASGSSYLSVTPATGSALLAALPVGNAAFTLSSWFKCAAGATFFILSWGPVSLAAGRTLSGNSALSPGYNNGYGYIIGSLGSAYGAYGITSDANGNIYFAEYDNNDVKKYSGGSFSVIATGFKNPRGVALDSSGNLFVSDTGNNAIKKITPDGIMTTHGSGFSSPYGIATDSSGNLFVSDFANNAIKKVTPTGATSTLATGVSTAGVAVDSAGNIFATESSSGLLLKITPSGSATTFVSGFNSPSGIAIDFSNNIYIGDLQNNAVKKISPTGVVTTVGGTYRPAGVAVDPSGTVWAGCLGSSALIAFSQVSTQTACDSKWHHLAVTHGDGVAAATKTYLDGSLISSSSQTLALPSDGTASLDINFNSMSRLSGGAASEMRIYSRALTSAEALALSQPLLSSFTVLYVTPLAIVAPGVLLYPFACAAGSVGPGAQFLVKSSVDNSWSWLEDAAPSCTPCAAGSFAPQGTTACMPCPPGTYSLVGAASCSLCPAGTFGDHAGLTSNVCSGTCSSCTAGSTSSSALNTAISSMTCSTANSRAVPSSYGLQIWPAAHPANPQRVDLVIAPATMCAQMSPGGVCTTLAVNQITGSDGITRFVVGTAAAFHMEASETLECAVPSPTPSPSLTPSITPSVTPIATPSVTPSITSSASIITNAACTGASYSYGTSTCSTCPAGATVVSGNARGCTPSSALTSGPSDSLAFYLSGTAAEGVAAFSIAPTSPAYTTGVYGAANSALYFASGSSYLSVTPATGSALLAALPVGNAAFTLSSWFKCAAGATFFILSWGPVSLAAGRTLSGNSALSPGYNNGYGYIIGSLGSAYGAYGITSDANGNIYFAEYDNNDVKKYSGGSFSVIATGFKNPRGVALDSSGNLFVSDTGNNAIKKITPDGIMTTHGSGFSSPYGIATDSSGNLFVSDFANNAIKKVTPTGATSTLATGVSTAGVAVDSAGNIFATESSSGLLLKITPSGSATTFVSGFNSPSGIAIDFSNNIYIGDLQNNAVKKISPTGVVTTVGGTYRPAGVAVDPSGTVWAGCLGSSALIAFSQVSTQTACDSKWHHLAVTHGDGVAAATKTYLDGSLISSSSQTLALPSDGTASLDINFNSMSRLSGGAASEMRIYSRALTSAEALALSQPLLSSFTVLYVTPLAIVAPGVLLYPFACAAGSVGPGAQFLVKSSVDNSWSWLEDAAPSCTPCAAGSFAPQGTTACMPCPPGTYSLVGAASCSLCPAGTFGDHAGLTSNVCSGTCSSCTAGSTSSSALNTAISSMTCSTANSRAVPSSYGLQIWPAAHPANPQRVDLVIAPATMCAQMSPGGVCTTLAVNQITGSDGITRFVVGTAAAFHMEASETLECA